MTFLSRLLRIEDYIITGMAAIAGTLLLFMMFSICYEVILRYFLFRPPGWVTEVTEYILLYSAFLGAPWLLRQDGHVSVDVILSRLRPQTRRVLNLITSFLGLAVCLILVWFGAWNAWENYARGIPVIKTLSVPKYCLVGVIPVGCFFLSIEFVRRIARFYFDNEASEVRLH